MNEHELTAPVSLTRKNGTLNRAAVGFARTPLVDTSGIGRGWRGKGRNKRWEYWNVITPTHIAALTISSLDYAAVHEVWIYDRAAATSVGKSVTVVPSKGVELPGSLAGGVSSAQHRDLSATITPLPGGDTAITAAIADGAIEVTVHRPADHDALAVVVPWSDTRFQYTVKDVALPVSGTIRVGDQSFDVPREQSWAVLDHGRGRWPYNITWNWGAGSGRSGGRVIGLQVGARWTAGTPMTENGVVVDGVLYKIGVELDWAYNTDNFMAPWQISGGGLAATLTPFHDKSSETNLGLLSGNTHQCFGTWTGQFDTGTEVIAFTDLVGFAEHVHNRW